MTVVGNRSDICFEIAEAFKGGLLKVDIWLADLHVTYVDNRAFLPSFTYSLELDVKELRFLKPGQNIRFLDAGPTTEDIEDANIRLVSQDVVEVSVELANKKTASKTMPLGFLLGVLDDAIETLNTRYSNYKNVDCVLCHPQKQGLDFV